MKNYSHNYKHEVVFGGSNYEKYYSCKYEVVFGGSNYENYSCKYEHVVLLGGLIMKNYSHKYEYVNQGHTLGALLLFFSQMQSSLGIYMYLY